MNNTTFKERHQQQRNHINKLLPQRYGQYNLSPKQFNKMGRNIRYFIKHNLSGNSNYTFVASCGTRHSIWLAHGSQFMGKSDIQILVVYDRYYRRPITVLPHDTKDYGIDLLLGD